MFIRIESSSGMPITRQIIDQIRACHASGAIAPGERLPSVRQLAHQLAVNQNTILRVYERLEAEGLIERRHGDGTYVTQNPVPGQLAAQRELLRDEAERLARRASTLGLSATECQRLLKEAFEKMRNDE